MEYVVVERSFDAPICYEDFQGIRKKGAWCLELYRIEYLRSYLSADGRRMICIYRAPDAEAVRQASGRLGVPFDRAWTASRHAPADGRSGS